MLSLKASGKTNTSGYFADYFNNLFAKKRKLVKLELDLVDRVRSEWDNILGSTITDRDRAESSVKSCYRYAGLASPTIIWIEHPLQIVPILIDRPELSDVSGVIINEIWQSELKIQQSIDPDATAYILANIDPQHTVNTANGNVRMDRISDRLNDLVLNRANEIYSSLTDRTLPTPLQDYRIGDLGYFDYFLQIGLNIPQIQPAIDLAKAGGWCWTFKKLAILSPKPTKVKIDRQGKIVGIIYNNVNILSESNHRS
jgi:hypothetical protein